MTERKRYDNLKFPGMHEKKYRAHLEHLQLVQAAMAGRKSARRRARVAAG